ncbi:MAG: hypothetical protein ACRDH0_05090 [Actinomycetota bacterium]|jgi:hypothetical protein
MSRASKAAIVAVLTLATLIVGASAAMADAPKFHSASSSVDDSGALVVKWDERGLGNENIDYTLTADATALYACLNKGGNHPQAANKESFEGQVSTGGSFEPKNGRVQGTLTAGPLMAPSFTCPKGQRRVLAAVTYTNIVLTDTTNNVSTSVPDASREFFAV